MVLFGHIFQDDNKDKSSSPKLQETWWIFHLQISLKTQGEEKNGFHKFWLKLCSLYTKGLWKDMNPLFPEFCFVVSEIIFLILKCHNDWDRKVWELEQTIFS